MKVVMVNNLYPPNVRGGAERSVQLLAEALVGLGVEVTVVCTDEESRAPVTTNGVKIVTVAMANLDRRLGKGLPPSLRRKLWHVIDTYNPIMRARVFEVLRAEKPDIVHTNNLQGISVAAWRAALAGGFPVLHTLRDYYLSCARASRFRCGQNCLRTCRSCAPFCAFRRRASRMVHAVVGTSRFILDRHIELGFFSGASLRAVIGNSAVPVVLSTSSRQATVFGVLGRLEEVKGVDRLLQAFAERDDGGWELLIAGSGPAALVEQLHAAAARAQRPRQIRFLGWTDAADFLQRVDVVVVPSLWHEPLSRTAIEAQVSGLAVIAARRGGLPEIVEDGVTGLLFDPDQPGSLKRAIDTILHQPALVRRFGAAAGSVADRFGTDRIAGEYVRRYEAAIVAKGRNAKP